MVCLTCSTQVSCIGCDLFSSSVIELSTNDNLCNPLLIIVGGAVDAPLSSILDADCPIRITAFLGSGAASAASLLEWRTSITCPWGKGLDAELSVTTITISPGFIGDVLV